jgi:hypothetical protein
MKILFLFTALCTTIATHASDQNSKMTNVKVCVQGSDNTVTDFFICTACKNTPVWDAARAIGEERNLNIKSLWYFMTEDSKLPTLISENAQYPLHWHHDNKCMLHILASRN